MKNATEQSLLGIGKYCNSLLTDSHFQAIQLPPKWKAVVDATMISRMLYVHVPLFYTHRNTEKTDVKLRIEFHQV